MNYTNTLILHLLTCILKLLSVPCSVLQGLPELAATWPAIIYMGFIIIFYLPSPAQTSFASLLFIFNWAAKRRDRRDKDRRKLEDVQKSSFHFFRAAGLCLLSFQERMRRGRRILKPSIRELFHVTKPSIFVLKVLGQRYIIHIITKLSGQRSWFKQWFCYQFFESQVCLLPLTYKSGNKFWLRIHHVNDMVVLPL